MSKELAMVTKKKKEVEERKKRLTEVCKEFVKNNNTITYKVLSENTEIPIKTLQRNPYCEVIREFKRKQDKNILNVSNPQDILSENKYLKSIIEKLKLENRTLRTEIYTMLNNK